MNTKIRILAAFVPKNMVHKDKEASGNLAGVVLDSDDLSSEKMQEIAKICSLSEVAFIQSSKIADFKLRFFTPETEVDLCGHATIAAFTLLLKQQIIKPNRYYTQETHAGLLNVFIQDDGMILMDQKLPVFDHKSQIDLTLLAKSLGISSDKIVFKPEIVSTGLRDLFIGLDSKETLATLLPNYELISKISIEHDCIGMHVYTLDRLPSEGSVHCRNFAPRVGIKEESATGTANAALAALLYVRNRISSQTMLFKQGHFMGRPSEIYVTIESKPKNKTEGKHLDNENKIMRLQLGGYVSIC